jgi:AcrR family transcriptional regulator
MDILDALQIAKGTFYHYFDSKQALLEAVVERLLCQTEQLFQPILEDPGLSALDRLNRFFSAQGRYKLAQLPLMLAILRVWYTDENAIVRQKTRLTMSKRIAPLLAQIVRQGVEEGVFATDYPEESGEVVFSLAQDLVDALACLLLSPELKPDAVAKIERTVAAYTDAIERALGAPARTLVLADAPTLRQSVSFLIANLERREG